MLQLMSSANDDRPVVIDTLVHIVRAAWNHDGTLLVVAGTLRHAGDGSDANVARFYTCQGLLVHEMQLPKGKEIAGAILCSC